MASLHCLAGRGDPFELLAALEAGADPNERGQDGKTPLMMAVKYDNVVAARLLLRRGADIDALTDDGCTALLEASSLAMRRLLLDAGADPDGGRTAGMTLMAFFGSFRDRRWVDFFLSYGANPEERVREGQTVRELLDDPATVWMKPFPERMDTREHRRRTREAILRLSGGLRLTPEAFVAAHRNILIWSFGAYPYDDPMLAKWAQRVAEILGSPDAQEAAYRLHLSGDTLQEALRSLTSSRRRAERRLVRQRREAEFAAMYFPEWAEDGQS